MLDWSPGEAVYCTVVCIYARHMQQRCVRSGFEESTGHVVEVQTAEQAWLLFDSSSLTYY